MEFIQVPFSNEAEQAVIGGLIMDQSKFDAVSSIVCDQDFYFDGHREAFVEISRLIHSNIAIDVVTLSERLKMHENGDENLAYIANLARNTPGTSNILNYAHIVKKKSKFRRVIGIAEHLVTQSYAEDEDATMDAIRELMALETLDKKYTYSMVETLEVVLDKIDQDMKNGTVCPGIPTGITELDNRLGGMRDGHLIIVGARPRMGKTAMMLNIMDRCGAKVGLISSEQGHDQIGMRALSINGLVNTQKMSVPATLDEMDWAKLTGALARLKEREIYIYDKAGPSIDEIEREARRMKQEYGIEILLVDYIQRIKAKAFSRREEVGLIAMRLKEIARELNIPVVAGAQIVREIEKRPDKRPLIADLKEAGAIEEEADQIFLLYRDDVYNDNSEYKGTAEIDVGKNRHGPDGMVRTVWRGEFLRFEDYANETY